MVVSIDPSTSPQRVPMPASAAFDELCSLARESALIESVEAACGHDLRCSRHELLRSSGLRRADHDILCPGGDPDWALWAAGDCAVVARSARTATAQMTAIQKTTGPNDNIAASQDHRGSWWPRPPGANGFRSSR